MSQVSTAPSWSTRFEIRVLREDIENLEEEVIEAREELENASEALKVCLAKRKKKKGKTPTRAKELELTTAKSKAEAVVIDLERELEEKRLALAAKAPSEMSEPSNISAESNNHVDPNASSQSQPDHDPPPYQDSAIPVHDGPDNRSDLSSAVPIASRVVQRDYNSFHQPANPSSSSLINALGYGSQLSQQDGYRRSSSIPLENVSRETPQNENVVSSYGAVGTLYPVKPAGNIQSQSVSTDSDISTSNPNRHTGSSAPSSLPPAASGPVDQTLTHEVPAANSVAINHQSYYPARYSPPGVPSDSAHPPTRYPSVPVDQYPATSGSAPDHANIKEPKEEDQEKDSPKPFTFETGFTTPSSFYVVRSNAPRPPKVRAKKPSSLATVSRRRMEKVSVEDYDQLTDDSEEKANLVDYAREQAKGYMERGERMYEWVKRLIRTKDDFAPDLVIIDPRLTQHILTSQIGNFECTVHSRAGATGTESSKLYNIDGTIGPRLMKHKKDDDIVAAPGCMNCGCPPRIGLMGIIIQKHWYAEKEVYAGTILEGYRGATWDARHRYFLIQNFWRETGLSLDDFFIGKEALNSSAALWEAKQAARRRQELKKAIHAVKKLASIAYSNTEEKLYQDLFVATVKAVGGVDAASLRLQSLRNLDDYQGSSSGATWNPPYQIDLISAGHGAELPINIQDENGANTWASNGMAMDTTSG